MVVYSVLERSEKYKPVRSVLRVVAMLSTPLSYTLDRETRDGRANDNKDVKRGRFWQNSATVWSLSSS